MPPAAEPQHSFLEPPPLRRRLAALALAALANLLLLLVLLRLAPPFAPPPQTSGRLVSIPLDEGQPDKVVRAKSTAKAKRSSGGAPPRAPASAPAPRAAAPPTKPVTDTGEHTQLLELSQADLSATDRAMKAPHAESGAAGEGSGSGTGGGIGAGDSKTAGVAPNGEPLYNAEWYREPTHAEMATYLPRQMATSGWGEVACRTVARYHVEDCVELGQSPPGSGLSRALREASFQFLVRPPRVGGKVLVGTWVRIHFDFTLRKESE